MSEVRQGLILQGYPLGLSLRYILEELLSGITEWRYIRLEISLLFSCVVIYCHLYFKIVLFKVRFEMAVLSGTA